MLGGFAQMSGRVVRAACAAVLVPSARQQTLVRSVLAGHGPGRAGVYRPEEGCSGGA